MYSNILCILYLLIPIFSYEKYFTKTNGTDLINRGEVMRYGGSNCHYLHHVSNYMVDVLFKDAYDMKMQVIRTFAFDNVEAAIPDVWFQYYDKQKQEMVINTDGDNGLKYLDYVMYSARKHQIKLILSLSNNWERYGGIDMYQKWFGFENHEDFYTQQQPRNAYKNYMNVLLNRKNTYTGDLYKNDDTIMSFELMNEPRCPGCSTSVVRGWIEEMSSYFKSIDQNHLLGIGDEGFFNRSGSGSDDDWTYNGTEGMDFDEFMKIPGIDYGAVHLYPEAWSKDYDKFSYKWIKDHAASQYDKPVILQEFGIRDKARRLETYRAWLNEALKYMSGWNYWMLASWEDGGKERYPDGGLTVYYDTSDPVARLLSSKSHRYRFYDD